MLLPRLSTLLRAQAAVRAPVSQAFVRPRFSRNLALHMSTLSEGIALMVQVEIEPTRLDEFVDVIKADAEGSRTEPGCLRFDVLQDQSAENKVRMIRVIAEDLVLGTNLMDSQC